MGSVIIVILVSLFFSAFFSGMEIAFVSSNKLRLEIERKQSGLFARISEVFVRRPGRYITSILVGNNIALVVYSLNMTVLLHALAVGWNIPVGSVVLETVISTIIIIFAAEFTPKAIVRRNPNFWFRVLIVPVYICYVLLYPIARFTTWLSMGLLRLFGLPVKDDRPLRRFDMVDLEALLEEGTPPEGNPDNEIKIFQNALDFSGLRVRDCMIPRVDVEAVPADATVEQLTERFVESKYSRIFVWDGSIDNIIGYVNIKSLLRSPRSVREVLMTVDFVPETMPAQRLLTELTRNKASVAVVIDEFGGTAGIISLEDVLEEIFGDIEDEHDAPDLIEKQVGEGEWIFSCRLEVEYVNEKYGLGIDESDQYDTLAGWIIAHADGIPPVGASLTIGNKQIRILRSSSSRLELARIKMA